MDSNGVVRFTAKSENQAIVVQVQDSGIGIAADFLPHVFEMFKQADSSVERSRRGLGIGLALVKSLVELHGGTVEAHSSGRNQGSVFTVRLPVTVAPANVTAPANVAPDSEHSAGANTRQKGADCR